MRGSDSRQLFLGKSVCVWGDPRVGSFPEHCLAPPEWDQCAGTFSAIVVCSVAFGLIVMNSGWEGGVGEILGGLGAALGCLAAASFLSVALSDPGIVMQSSTDEDAVECQKCEMMRPKNASYCETCGCCVVKIDHHCPFIGRCVAQKNLGAFHLFTTAVIVGAVFMLPTVFLSVMQMMVDKGAWGGVTAILLILLCCCSPRLFSGALCRRIWRAAAPRQKHRPPRAAGSKGAEEDEAQRALTGGQGQGQGSPGHLALEGGAESGAAPSAAAL